MDNAANAVRDYAGTLKSDVLEDTWRQYLRSSGGGTGAQQLSRIATAVARTRDQFLAIIDDIPDTEEREHLTALFYAMVRCQWSLLNAQSGYRIAAGNIDPSTHCHSGMLSALLDQIEKCMDSRNAEAIAEFLAQPRSYITATLQQTADRDADFAQRQDIARLTREVAELRNSIHVLQVERDILKSDAAEARAERALLKAHIGSSDAQTIVRQVQDLQERLAAVADLQSMLGTLEETVNLLNV